MHICGAPFSEISCVVGGGGGGGGVVYTANISTTRNCVKAMGFACVTTKSSRANKRAQKNSGCAKPATFSSLRNARERLGNPFDTRGHSRVSKTLWIPL